VPAITIDKTRAPHIFRVAEGHFAEDTPVSRQALLDAVNNPANLVGRDRFGNAWFTQSLADGTQVWAQVRDGKITNGGVNRRPRVLRIPG
jgi:filamentous hemagglutinin